MHWTSALALSRHTAPGFAALGMLWGAFAVLVPVIKPQVGASDGLFGLLMLGSAFGLVASMWLAPLADRRFGAFAQPVAVALLISAFLLPGLTTTPVAFFAAMLAVGIGSGLTDVIVNARVSDVESAENRSLMNLNHGAFSVAYAISAAGTGIAREIGAAPATVFATIFAVALVSLPMMVRAPAATAPTVMGRGSAGPLGILLICGGIALIAFMAEAGVETWAALHIERTLGGRAAEGALGPTMLGLTMAVGRLGGQAVSARFAETQVIAWAGALSIAGALIVAAAPAPWVAYAGFATLGLGISVIGPLGLALIGRLSAPEHRVAAISRVAVIGFSGFIIAPPLMGFTAELSSLRVSYTLIAVMLVGLYPLLAIARRRGA